MPLGPLAHALSRYTFIPCHNALVHAAVLVSGHCPGDDLGETEAQ